MKIVRIIARLNVGGPARHVVWLTKELEAANVQTTLIAGSVPGGEEDMGWFARENQVEPVYIREMSRELSPKDVVSLWKVYREIRRQAPDIVHTHTAKAGFVGRTAAFLYRLTSRRPVKIVHTFHGHIFHSYYGKLKTSVFLFIEKTLARVATDKIIVISRQQFGEIHRAFGVGRADQFEIVPLGIDTGKFAAAAEKRNVLRREIGASDNEVLIGFVGRLTAIKDVSLLLAVAELYRQTKQTDYPELRFVIIGDGDRRENLEREAVRRGLPAETVLFLGNRPDAPVFYAGLDIVALTSLNEGTPLSLIEAMANGKPVISTAVGGVVDLVGDSRETRENFVVGERGVLVADRQAKSFLDALLYLAKDEKLQKRMGAHGKNFIEANYDKRRLVADLETLYQDLMR